uniref:BRCT domain-containing protein n=1 Tax=Leersia perrieri TaxID=77586 RepID=A0A0D9VA31_9ORYZ
MANKKIEHPPCFDSWRINGESTERNPRTLQPSTYSTVHTVVTDSRSWHPLILSKAPDYLEPAPPPPAPHFRHRRRPRPCSSCVTASAGGGTRHSFSSHHDMHMMTSASESARLDYLNSQEPGDESQMNAIDVVDKLFVEDDIETYQNISTDQIMKAKSASTFSSGIAQCLVKKAECSFPLKKAGIFDWADTPTVDDCTTSIFSMENTRDHANNQVKHVDSQKCGGYGSGTRARPVLECIDEDSGTSCLKKPEPFSCTGDLYQEYDVGPNTQMAAEAMEALFNASTVSYDAKENERPEGSVVINMTKGTKIDKTNAVHSPIQKRSGVATEYKQIKVDDTPRENAESSISYTKRPNMSKTRKYPKKMAGKGKGNIISGIIQRDIHHKVSEVITKSGTDDSNIPLSLGADALIHPKRRRTYMFTSGSSKVEFIEAVKSTALRAKTTEVKQLSTAKTASISDRDTATGMRMSSHSSLADQEASAASSYFNPLVEIFSVGHEKCSVPGKKGHDSSLMHSVPLKELSSAEPQARTCTSKKILKRVLKSAGSRELASLLRNEVSPVLQSSRRRRRHMSTVRVLFSQSMDNETLNNQTKILIHFGLSMATTISEATHFVAEKFARTRNMLEAIAMGIPVVTPAWLECCEEARCFVDEKRYILRDTKKEKELGFSMPVSLSRACKKPLLEGRRVLITPNAKPSKEVLKSLVVAAHGKLLERITMSKMKNRSLAGAFVISCEQDYSICVTFIKNGFEVFDSELVLNGIVTQNLEFERYRLFHNKT